MNEEIKAAIGWTDLSKRENEVKNLIEAEKSKAIAEFGEKVKEKIAENMHPIGAAGFIADVDRMAEEFNAKVHDPKEYAEGGK